MILTLAGLILAAILSFTSYQKLESSPLKQKFLQVAIALFVVFGALILLIILLMTSPLAILAASKGTIQGFFAAGVVGILGLLLVLTILIAAIAAVIFAWQTYLASVNTEYNLIALITALAITVGIALGGMTGISFQLPSQYNLGL